MEPLSRETKGSGKLAFYLLRFWVLGVPLALIGLALGWYLKQDYVPSYRADSLVALERSVDATDPTDLMQEQTLLQSEAVILQSRSLSSAVVERLELDETLTVLPDWDARLTREARLRRASAFADGALGVEEQIGRRALRIFVETPDAVLSADIANAAADIFIEERANRSRTRWEQDRQSAEERVSALRAELRAAEERLFEEVEIGDADGGGLSRTELRQQLIRAESRTSRLQVEADRLDSMNPVSLAAVDPELASLRLERGRLQDEYNRLSEDFGPRHPRMVAIQDQIDALEAQFQAGIAERKLSARDALEAARAEEADLRAQLEDTESRMRESVQTEFATSSLKRDVDLLEVQLGRAVEEFARLQNRSVSGPLFTIRERAAAPDTPVASLEPYLHLIGFLAGGALGFLLFVLQDRLRDRVSHPRDVSEKLGQKLIGVVPKEKSQGKVAAAYFDPQAPIAEAAASIVARLIKKKRDGQAMVVHITSTRSGEGKSTLALALARAFASTGAALNAEEEVQELTDGPVGKGEPVGKTASKSFSGLRTLIVDADLRRPSFSAESETGVGLETVLRDTTLLNKALRPTSNKALFLLPCNAIAENPAGLLGGDNLAKIINVLRSVLDVIVIDGPPTLGLADAALIGQTSDFSLYIVEQNGVRRDQVAASIERLEDSGCTVGGVVLTKFDLAAFGQADMYRYTYGNESYEYGDGKRGSIFGRFKSSDRSIQLK